VKNLLNSRMAYVAVSRGAYDAQIFTNDSRSLGHELSRDISHAPAIQQAPFAQSIDRQPGHTHENDEGFGIGL
jgi:hypothetical protein